jgi:glycosyltransferase involved in cell wall biosynthesis
MENQNPRFNATLVRYQNRFDFLHIAVVTEDLRLPLDEGAKKASFHIVGSFLKLGVKVSIFTLHENPLLTNVFPLPHNKLLLGYTFARDLRAVTSDAILYIPLSSGTLGAFVRAAMIKAQSSSKPLALLSLQYRQLPVFMRYFNPNQFADIVFTQSQASNEVYHSLGCKTSLLPCGVDHTVFQPVDRQKKDQLRSKYGLGNNARIILHVGHCNRQRNVSILARLVELGFCVILIASTSTNIERILLDELRKSGVKVIDDYVDNIQDYYQMADCYVFPVLNVTSAIDAPLSVLEAMACNLPIVTTRFGAIPGMFQPGQGLYFADNNEEILRNVKLGVEEKDVNTLEMVAPYSWDNVALRLLEELQQVFNL